jgi:hypothetical protein
VFRRSKVRGDPIGRQRFVDTMQRLHVTAVGVPTFVLGERFVTGFRPGGPETELERLVDDALAHRDARADGGGDGVQTKLLGWLSARELGLPILQLDSLAIVTPSSHTSGAPHFFSIGTRFDFGPSVTRTASLEAVAPRSSFSRAAESKRTCLGDMRRCPATDVP